MAHLSVSICVPAFNEEKNIRLILDGLVHQKTDQIKINNIIVVSSGSTDHTDTIVKDYTKEYSSIKLISEQRRNGKAAAINTFLQTVSDPVVVVQSSDTIPVSDTIEQLCSPFLRDKRIGMTGGAPIPLNDPNTCLGYIVHTWWWFHRNIPRFGEIVAFRNILPRISSHTAVDEAFIQAKMIKMGYKVIHIDEAVVRNKGAETFGDIIKQRRRIFNGHSRLFQEENIKIDHMTRSTFKLLLLHYQIHSFKQLLWLLTGVGIEAYAQLLGLYDMYIARKNPVTWDIASSTKRLLKKGESFSS